MCRIIVTSPYEQAKTGGSGKRSDPPEPVEGLPMVCPSAIGKAFGPFDFAQGRLLPLPPGHSQWASNGSQSV